MRKIAWRLLPLLGAAAAVLGLALGSVPASASTHAPAKHAPAVHAGNNNSFTSSAFAGYSLDGNGTLVVKGLWRQLVVPNEANVPPVPADTVVDGLIMANNLATGNYAVGEGLVLNDPKTTASASCTAGSVDNQWTLEDGEGTITLGVNGKPTLPASKLHPILYYGGEICITGAGSYFAYLYDSQKHHQVDFSAGPSSHDWNVLDQTFVPLTDFRTAGAGISACSTGAQICPSPDNAAADLISGSQFDGTGVGIFTNNTKNSVFGNGTNFYALGYDSWEGTVNGGAVTPTNPLTLAVNPSTTLVGPYGQYSEIVG